MVSCIVSVAMTFSSRVAAAADHGRKGNILTSAFVHVDVELRVADLSGAAKALPGDHAITQSSVSTYLCGECVFTRAFVKLI